MKRLGWLSLAVVITAASLFANDAKDQQKEITGTICNSACVVPQSDLPTCDLSCTDKSGDVVLVDDAGKVQKIANPKMAMGHMKKHVKCTVAPNEKDREEAVRIQRLIEMSN